MLFRPILLAILFFATGQSFSQSIDTAKLNRYFEALEANNKFMGSVAIARDGKLLYTNTIGFRDVENKITATVTSMYRIGSISKTFTTVLAFIAMEKGKLNLDQTIDQYFPSIPNADKITIRQLMYHRSGIHNFTENDDYPEWNINPKTQDQMTDIIAKGGSDFEPDSKSQYSNSNFVLLSYILEKIYDEPYSFILKKNIVDRIKLQHTYFGSAIDPHRNECYSYSMGLPMEKEPETNMCVPMGAGGIVSTPTDLVLFGDALFSGKFISEKSLEQMKTIRDGYGMGLFQVPFYEKKGFGHTGGIDGFTSSFFYFPEDKIAFALTSNFTNYNNNDIGIAVLSSVFNKPYEIPVFTTYSISDHELDPFIGLYTSEQLPHKITVTKKDSKLYIQSTGQSEFPLEASGPSSFKIEQFGIVMEFNATEKTMVLKQGGGEYLFKKQE